METILGNREKESEVSGKLNSNLTSETADITFSPSQKKENNKEDYSMQEADMKTKTMETNSQKLNSNLTSETADITFSQSQSKENNKEDYSMQEAGMKTKTKEINSQSKFKEISYKALQDSRLHKELVDRRKKLIMQEFQSGITRSAFNIPQLSLLLCEVNDENASLAQRKLSKSQFELAQQEFALINEARIKYEHELISSEISKNTAEIVEDFTTVLKDKASWQDIRKSFTSQSNHLLRAHTNMILDDVEDKVVDTLRSLGLKDLNELNDSNGTEQMKEAISKHDNELQKNTEDHETIKQDIAERFDMAIKNCQNVSDSLNTKINNVQEEFFGQIEKQNSSTIDQVTDICCAVLDKMLPKALIPIKKEVSEAMNIVKDSKQELHLFQLSTEKKIEALTKDIKSITLQQIQLQDKINDIVAENEAISGKISQQTKHIGHLEESHRKLETKVNKLIGDQSKEGNNIKLQVQVIQQGLEKLTTKEEEDKRELKLQLDKNASEIWREIPRLKETLEKKVSYPEFLELQDQMRVLEKASPVYMINQLQEKVGIMEENFKKDIDRMKDSVKSCIDLREFVYFRTKVDDHSKELASLLRLVMTMEKKTQTMHSNQHRLEAHYRNQLMNELNNKNNKIKGKKQIGTDDFEVEEENWSHLDEESKAKQIFWGSVRGQSPWKFESLDKIYQWMNSRDEILRELNQRFKNIDKDKDEENGSTSTTIYESHHQNKSTKVSKSEHNHKPMSPHGQKNNKGKKAKTKNDDYDQVSGGEYGTTSIFFEEEVQKQLSLLRVHLNELQQNVNKLLDDTEGSNMNILSLKEAVINNERQMSFVESQYAKHVANVLTAQKDHEEQVQSKSEAMQTSIDERIRQNKILTDNLQADHEKSNNESISFQEKQRHEMEKLKKETEVFHEYLQSSYNISTRTSSEKLKEISKDLQRRIHNQMDFVKMNTITKEEYLAMKENMDTLSEKLKSVSSHIFSKDEVVVELIDPQITSIKDYLHAEHKRLVDTEKNLQNLSSAKTSLELELRRRNKVERKIFVEIDTKFNKLSMLLESIKKEKELQKSKKEIVRHENSDFSLSKSMKNNKTKNNFQGSMSHIPRTSNDSTCRRSDATVSTTVEDNLEDLSPSPRRLSLPALESSRRRSSVDSRSSRKSIKQQKFSFDDDSSATATTHLLTEKKTCDGKIAQTQKEAKKEKKKRASVPSDSLDQNKDRNSSTVYLEEKGEAPLSSYPLNQSGAYTIPLEGGINSLPEPTIL